MYIYIYVYIQIYIYIYIHIYVHIYIYMCIHVQVYIRICIHTHIYVYTCTCVNKQPHSTPTLSFLRTLSLSVPFTHTHTHAHARTHTHTHTPTQTHTHTPALGKTALLLSGGASLGMYHFGVIKALFLQGLLPRVISGSSAGSIVLAILGVKTADELCELFTSGPEGIQAKIRLDFFSNKGSLHRKLTRIFSKGVIMDIEKLQEALRQNIGDITFSEAYARTGRIINITVSPGNHFENARLLNYLTAPNVLVWSAASASCALPGLYESVQLMAKNEKGNVVAYHLSNVTWTDGSLQQDLPINRLKELFNVNYLIVSQTNPHAIPFIQTEQRGSLRVHKRSEQPGILRRIFTTATYLVCSEVMLRCHQLVDLGLAPGMLSLVLNQQVQSHILKSWPAFCCVHEIDCGADF